MSKIKEVINSLCRIIDHLGFSPLTAEDLRLAKFNKPEVVCKYSFFSFENKFVNLLDSAYMNLTKVLKMWSFLHELVLFIKSKDLSVNRFDYSSPGKLEHIRYLTPSLKFKRTFF